MLDCSFFLALARTAAVPGDGGDVGEGGFLSLAADAFEGAALALLSDLALAFAVLLSMALATGKARLGDIASENEIIYT
jgi:hypothetical protein